MEVLPIAFFIACMLIVEWGGRGNQFGLEKVGMTWNKTIRYIFYLIITCLIIAHFPVEKSTEFIYFQF
jgi:hypothetical protein